MPTRDTQPFKIGSLGFLAQMSLGLREAAKRSSRLKMQHGHYFVPRTFVGPKPGDFPLGSLHSRAAARAIVAEYLDVDREKEDAALAGLTPAAQACIEGQVVDNPLVRRWMIYLARFADELAR